MSKEKPTSKIEYNLRKKGYSLIAGIDESGRGSLAGPVVAAAVILPPKFRIQNVRDSKTVPYFLRLNLYEKIKRRALSIGVGIVDEKTIDRINIFQATFLAMRKAIANLEINPYAIIVDGKFSIPGIPFPQFPIVKGDRTCKSVACASIVAKVVRDQIMQKADQDFKGFGFAKHKGYATKLHSQKIKDFGPSKFHRLSFLKKPSFLNAQLFSN